MIDIKTILEPFSLTIGKKQDFLTLLVHLRNNEISLDDLIEYLKKIKDDQIKFVREQEEGLSKQKRLWNKIALKCPTCRSPMQLLPVNTQPGDQTGDSSKSVWTCSNKECMETIYNSQTVQEILNQLRGKL